METYTRDSDKKRFVAYRAPNDSNWYCLEPIDENPMPEIKVRDAIKLDSGGWRGVLEVKESGPVIIDSWEGCEVVPYKIVAIKRNDCLIWETK
jgi:hypothetical protein